MKKQRGMEILAFIKMQKDRVSSFICIDDMDLCSIEQYKDIFGRHQVLTSISRGLNDEKVIEAISKLSVDGAGQLTVQDVDDICRAPELDIESFHYTIVPYHKQPTRLSCGPSSLRMALESLGVEIKELDDVGIPIEKSKSEKAVHSIQLALAARKFNLSVTITSTSLCLTTRHYEMPFYQSHSSLDVGESAELLKQAIEKGVRCIETEVPLEDILCRLRAGHRIVVLLDMNLVLSRPHLGYSGHYMPIVGYDDEFVILHNPATDSFPAYDEMGNYLFHGPYVKVTRELFEVARKGDGTDQDVIFLSHPGLEF
jgi:hypothetical protein